MSLLFGTVSAITLVPALLLAMFALLGNEEKTMARRVAVARAPQRRQARDVD